MKYDYDVDGTPAPAGVCLDFLGNELKKGDTIVYAVGAGRSQVLGLYEIVEVKWKWAPEWKGQQRILVPTATLTAKVLTTAKWLRGKRLATLFFPDTRASKVSVNQEWLVGKLAEREKELKRDAAWRTNA